MHQGKCNWKKGLNIGRKRREIFLRRWGEEVFMLVVRMEAGGESKG